MRFVESDGLRTRLCYVTVIRVHRQALRGIAARMVVLTPPRSSVVSLAVHDAICNVSVVAYESGR